MSARLSSALSSSSREDGAKPLGDSFLKMVQLPVFEYGHIVVAGSLVHVSAQQPTRRVGQAVGCGARDGQPAHVVEIQSLRGVVRYRVPS